MREQLPLDFTATPGPLLARREFLSGLQCHNQLWWLVHEPGAGELLPGANARSLMEDGQQIRRLAREYISGGRLIDFRFQNRRARVEATAAALKSGAAVLYEATFAAGGMAVQADILERNGAGWDTYRSPGQRSS